MTITRRRALIILTALFAVEGVACAFAGYSVGINTPCVDEEQFEIHPMEPK